MLDEDPETIKIENVYKPVYSPLVSDFSVKRVLLTSKLLNLRDSKRERLIHLEVVTYLIKKKKKNYLRTTKTWIYTVEVTCISPHQLRVHFRSFSKIKLSIVDVKDEIKNESF